MTTLNRRFSAHGSQFSASEVKGTICHGWETATAWLSARLKVHPRRNPAIQSCVIAGTCSDINGLACNDNRQHSPSYRCSALTLSYQLLARLWGLHNGHYAAISSYIHDAPRKPSTSTPQTSRDPLSADQDRRPPYSADRGVRIVLPSHKSQFSIFHNIQHSAY